MITKQEAQEIVGEEWGVIYEPGGRAAPFVYAKPGAQPYICETGEWRIEGAIFVGELWVPPEFFRIAAWEELDERGVVVKRHECSILCPKFDISWGEHDPRHYIEDARSGWAPEMRDQVRPIFVFSGEAKSFRPGRYRTFFGGKGLHPTKKVV